MEKNAFPTISWGKFISLSESNISKKRNFLIVNYETLGPIQAELRERIWGALIDPVLTFETFENLQNQTSFQNKIVSISEKNTPINKYELISLAADVCIKLRPGFTSLRGKIKKPLEVLLDLVLSSKQIDNALLYFIFIYDNFLLNEAVIYARIIDSLGLNLLSNQMIAIQSRMIKIIVKRTIEACFTNLLDKQRLYELYDAFFIFSDEIIFNLLRDIFANQIKEIELEANLLQELKNEKTSATDEDHREELVLEEIYSACDRVEDRIRAWLLGPEFNWVRFKESLDRAKKDYIDVYRTRTNNFFSLLSSEDAHKEKSLVLSENEFMIRSNNFFGGIKGLIISSEESGNLSSSTLEVFENGKNKEGLEVIGNIVYSMLNQYKPETIKPTVKLKAEAAESNKIVDPTTDFGKISSQKHLSTTASTANATASVTASGRQGSTSPSLAKSRINATSKSSNNLQRNASQSGKVRSITPTRTKGTNAAQVKYSTPIKNSNAGSTQRTVASNNKQKSYLQRTPRREMEGQVQNYTLLNTATIRSSDKELLETALMEEIGKVVKKYVPESLDQGILRAFVKNLLREQNKIPVIKEGANKGVRNKLLDLERKAAEMQALCQQVLFEDLNKHPLLDSDDIEIPKRISVEASKLFEDRKENRFGDKLANEQNLSKDSSKRRRKRTDRNTTEKSQNLLTDKNNNNDDSDSLVFTEIETFAEFLKK